MLMNIPLLYSVTRVSYPYVSSQETYSDLYYIREVDCHANLICDETSSEAVCCCQITVSEMEEKMAASETEIQQLKDSNKEYESLLDSFKTQVCGALCTLRNATVMAEHIC